MKKRNLILSLAIVVTIGLTGCGNSSEGATIEYPTENQAESPTPDEQSPIDEEPTTPTEETTEVAEISTGDDYLTANGIEITKATFEDGDLTFMHEGNYSAKYITFDVAETQTIVTIYSSCLFNEEKTEDITKDSNSGGVMIGAGSNDVQSTNGRFIVNFYDRTTGENILKKSDMYCIFDSGSRTLDAKDGFTVEVTGFERSKHYSNYYGGEWNFVSTTYTVTHPVGYNGLVMSLIDGGYRYDDMEVFSSYVEKEEAFTSEDYKLIDKHELNCYEYDVKKQADDGSWVATGEKAIKHIHPYYFTATGN